MINDPAQTRALNRVTKAMYVPTFSKRKGAPPAVRKACPNCEKRDLRRFYEAQTDPISGKRFWNWCYTCGWKA
jgi:hypothetical protein